MLCGLRSDLLSSSTESNPTTLRRKAVRFGFFAGSCVTYAVGEEGGRESRKEEGKKERKKEELRYTTKREEKKKRN